MAKTKDVKLTKEELLIHKNQIARMEEHTNKTVGGFSRYWCFNSDKTELIYKCSGDGSSFVANREEITNE